MALIRKRKNFRSNRCEERSHEWYNKTHQVCSESETTLESQKVIDRSTISDEYQKLHFSAEELASLLKKYGLDNFDWSSMV